MHEFRGQERPEASALPELKAQVVVSHPVWVIGAEFWFWKRAVHVLHHGDISPTSLLCILKQGLSLNVSTTDPFVSASTVLQVQNMPLSLTNLDDGD